MTMRQSWQGRRSSAALGFVVLATAGWTQVTVTFSGPNNGLYNAPANWSGGAVPFNDGPTTWNVIIPNNINVEFDRTTPTSVTGFNPRVGSTLTLNNGEQFTVEGVGVLSGTISATGAGTRFEAMSPFVVFSEGGFRAIARSGAVVRVSAASITNTFWGRDDYLSVDGPGSEILLPNLTSMTQNGSGWPSRAPGITATNSGVIDLSAVVTITGSTEGDDEWRFTRHSGGEIRLPNLTSVSRWTRFSSQSGVWTLPKLATASQAYLDITDGNSLRLPVLRTLDEGRLNISDGGSLETPELRTLTRSEVILNPSRQWTRPDITQMDDTRVNVFGGATFTSSDPTYLQQYWGGSDLFLADGAGSLLRFGFTSMTQNGGGWPAQAPRITARNNGVIDLPNLTTITGSWESDDEWQFIRQSGGEVRLPNVTSVNRWTRFVSQSGLWTLPRLATASQAYFDVTIFNTLRLPVLTSLNEGRLNIADGGTLETPLLGSLTRSVVVLNPSRFWIRPEITQIDHSMVHVLDGAKFATSDPSYINQIWGNSDLFLSDGPGSELTLGFTTMSQDFSSWPAQAPRIAARNFGVVDLSALTSITGSWESDDEWQFQARSGGQLFLGSWNPIGNRWQRLSLDGVDSRITILGDVNFTERTYVDSSTVPTLRVLGNLRFSGTTEANFRGENAKLLLDGATTQTYEAAGTDLGLPVGNIAPNFHFGQLTIGNPTQRSVVTLVDDVDNGNRPAGGKERAYFQGFPSDDGLRLFGGSVLVLNGIEAYAVINNQWTHINRLIPEGARAVTYDQGWIVLTPADIPGGEVKGTITLQGWSADPVGRLATFDLIQNGQVVETIPDVPLDGLAAYSFGTGRTGEHQIAVRVRGWLRQLRSAPVNLSPLGVNNVNFDLINGDIDGDNAVTVFDYDRLSAAFDKTSAEGDWATVDADGIAPMHADLDGDGAVTVFDYDILSASFDQVGD